MRLPLPHRCAAGTLRALETTMRFESFRPHLPALALLAALSFPGLASAEGQCSHEDLHGEFTLTVACADLQNFSGDFQDMKRLWLDGPLGEVHIMEAPSPFQTVELEVFAKTLGRHWTTRRSAAVREIEVAGTKALVTTRRRTTISSRTIIFKIGEQNVMARLAVVAKRKDADAALDNLEAAFVSGFALQEKK